MHMSHIDLFWLHIALSLSHTANMTASATERTLYNAEIDILVYENNK